jgi:chromate reductase
MQTRLKILAISGSLRANSAHTGILEYLKTTVTEHNISICEGIEDIPNFNPEKDTDSPADAVQLFRNQLAAADGVLICTPEYAYGIPGSLKNALDWTVSSGSFVDKPVSVITASGLGEHAHASLLLVLTALNAKIAKDGTILISWIRNKMNAENEITDLQTEQDIQNVLKALLTTIA